MVTAILCALGLVAVTFLYLLRRQLAVRDKAPGHHTTVVLGSGGHTTEMLRLLTALNAKKYRPFTYVVADTDSFSLLQVTRVVGPYEDSQVMRVPRSREVKQSWTSSVWTTLRQDTSTHSVFI